MKKLNLSFKSTIVNQRRSFSVYDAVTPHKERFSKEKLELLNSIKDKLKSLESWLIIPKEIKAQHNLLITLSPMFSADNIVANKDMTKLVKLLVNNIFDKKQYPLRPVVSGKMLNTDYNDILSNLLSDLKKYEDSIMPGEEMVVINFHTDDLNSMRETIVTKYLALKSNICKLREDGIGKQILKDITDYFQKINPEAFLLKGLDNLSESHTIEMLEKELKNIHELNQRLNLIITANSASIDEFRKFLSVIKKKYNYSSIIETQIAEFVSHLDNVNDKIKDIFNQTSSLLRCYGEYENNCFTILEEYISTNMKVKSIS